ncbi:MULTISPECIES: M23 family metallopeptidase [Streptomyces]|uniref:M23ase beta-sheet core domain-containing protein n=1 Tax=Streptomyces viridochromogenes TaxID=1938 RepID=A0A0L8J9F9_STRVR|nr:MULTISPECIES: M23 family metallopeptidase [Streptomyces]KOG10275.1 hypothetical protein ADK34_35675 [Streptomyces viridochromogenes]
MPKHAWKKTAMLAAGFGASLLWVTSMATAHDPHTAPTTVDMFAMNSARSPAAAVRTQAAAQQRAAEVAAARRQAIQAAARRAEKKAAAERAARDGRASELREASWVTPVRGYVLGAPYGAGGRLWARRHSGQDFVVSTGTPVHAAHGGTVVAAGWGGAYGYNIVIRHDAHTYTQYGHLSRIDVWVGRRVTTDQLIGRSGSTGNSTGPHLHFEVRTQPVYGYAIAPLTFLRSHGVRV